MGFDVKQFGTTTLSALQVSTAPHRTAHLLLVLVVVVSVELSGFNCGG